MAMSYKAKLSYYVEQGEDLKFLTLEIPVYAFEVNGGADRYIHLGSTNDIGITSEMEQARTHKNVTLWIEPGKKFNTNNAADLRQVADKKMKINVLFAVERYADGKMLEGIALLDRSADAYPPEVVEGTFAVDFSIPTAKLYYGKITGTHIANPQEF